MSLTMTIEVPVSFPHPGRGNPTELRSGADAASLPLGRVPRAGDPMYLQRSGLQKVQAPFLPRFRMALAMSVARGKWLGLSKAHCCQILTARMDLRSRLCTS